MKNIILIISLISFLASVYFIPYNLSRDPFEWYNFGNTVVLLLISLISFFFFSQIIDKELKNNK